MTELRKLTRRVAALEGAVAKLQRAVGGMAEVVNQARQVPIECVKCGNDYTTMKTCPVEDCPCGMPVWLEENTDD